MKNSVFTIDDIHKIRRENYEQTKDFTPQELIEYTKKAAVVGLSKIAEIRKPKTVAS